MDRKDILESPFCPPYLLSARHLRYSDLPPALFFLIRSRSFFALNFYFRSIKMSIFLWKKNSQYFYRYFECTKNIDKNIDKKSGPLKISIKVLKIAVRSFGPLFWSALFIDIFIGPLFLSIFLSIFLAVRSFYRYFYRYLIKERNAKNIDILKLDIFMHIFMANFKNESQYLHLF